MGGSTGKGALEQAGLDGVIWAVVWHGKQGRAMGLTTHWLGSHR